MNLIEPSVPDMAVRVVIGPQAEGNAVALKLRGIPLVVLGSVG